MLKFIFKYILRIILLLIILLISHYKFLLLISLVKINLLLNIIRLKQWRKLRSLLKVFIYILKLKTFILFIFWISTHFLIFCYNIICTDSFCLFRILKTIWCSFWRFHYTILLIGIFCIGAWIFIALKFIKVLLQLYSWVDFCYFFGLCLLWKLYF